jgi:transcriptional regulator with GAF, ATPase, and Fis domain
MLAALSDLRGRGLAAMGDDLARLEKTWNAVRSRLVGGLRDDASDEFERLIERLANRVVQMRRELDSAGARVGLAVDDLSLEARQSDRMRRRLETLHRVGKLVHSEIDLDVVMSLALDAVLEVTGAERGFLVLVERGRLATKVARNIDLGALTGEDAVLSETVVRRVVDERAPLLIRDAAEDERFKQAVSVVDLHLHSVLCVPLTLDDEVTGAIYIDNRTAGGIFSADDLDLMTRFAEFIAIAIRNATVVQDLARSQEALLRELRATHRFEEIVGTSRGIVEVLDLVSKVAESDVSILLLGESGTGKELIARATHANSGRSREPFVCINCAAIPEHLLEAELFGHEKGAFTGAVKARRGRFEAADRGTIFLDEIADMSPSLQAKLLRVLQDGRFEPLGSNEVREVDVRVIAATNRDLERLVREGTFREDLYYRLNVVEVRLPPLRERKEDIPLLVDHLLRRLASQTGSSVKSIGRRTLQAMMAYDYPGNVRELENIVKRAVVLAKGSAIALDDLPGKVRGVAAPGTERPPVTRGELRHEREAARKTAVAEVERAFVIEAMRRSGGNVARAAAAAEMDRRQFYRLLKKYGVSKEDAAGRNER